MSLKMSKTRRQKRINAEVGNCNNSFKKTPKISASRKALQNLQPSSDSPKVLVGSIESVRSRVYSKAGNQDKVNVKQSLTSKTSIEESLGKENASTVIRKPLNVKSSKKSAISSCSTDRISTKSNLSKQQKISDFISPVSKSKKNGGENSEKDYSVFYDEENVPSIICHENASQQGDYESLIDEYKCKAETIRLRLKDALKQNENLHNELSVLETDNANLKQIVDQILELRNQLQDYLEEQLPEQ